jgi:hypothetical protein
MIMALYHRVEQILEALRPVFRRQAAFEWFVLLMWTIVGMENFSLSSTFSVPKKFKKLPDRLQI